MNRDQKAAAIAEIAAHIQASQAIFAVDYKGISVPQAAELRAKLRDADATFKVVKNSLTERAADQAGADALKALLEGPTALTFVRGDAATAAKAIADYGRATQLLPFKGGLMDGAPLDPDQIRAISRLPSREALYGQLVGVVASPVSGLVRTLGALVSGLAVALGQVRDKKESGEIPAGESPAATVQAPAESAEQAEPPAPEEPQAEEPEAPALEEAQAEEAEAPAAEAEPKSQAEPEQSEPAQDDDNQADASAPDQPEAAEANPTKED
ncbi:MAG TPA: 50S ribosomal protein L10 [Solirubrobacteraceae bacterium]|nr:50S ribosomal protein L10 [Solirubrobacteraceae bacterium]